MSMENCMVEKALLCALFLEKAAILEVVSVLRPEMFSDPGYGFIYEAFTDLFNRGDEPDMVLVEVEMRKKDPEHCRRIGGISYLSTGMEEFRLEHNAVEYAKEIRGNYLLSYLHKLFVCKAAECLKPAADYRELVEKCEGDFLKLREDNRESGSLVPLSELAKEAISHQADRMNRKDDPVRMLTGIDGIDGLTGGIYRKELMILGGKTSGGKTALATFMAMNIARKGKAVLHFSFEMTGDQTMSRFFAGYAGVKADRLRIAGLREGDLQKMERYSEQLEGLPYYFVNVPSMKMEALRAEILLRKRRGECDAVVIDYLHSAAPLPDKKETQEAVIRAAITALKSIAVEADCAMLVLSQLNRDSNKHKEDKYIPMLSDLRDSGAIEYVADSVVMISRPEMDDPGYNRKGREPKRIDIYILKNRNGATGITSVLRNETFTQFMNPGGNLQFETDEQDGY